MRMLNWSTVVVVSLVLMTAACDSTVGLDPTRPTFTKVLVPGVCPANDSLSRVDLSVVLLHGGEALVPDSRIAREFRSVGELLSIDSFRFNKVPQDEGTGFGEPGTVVRDDGTNMKRGINLAAVDLEFAYPGSEDRKRDPRLVVLVMDHSGSLSGLDPITGRPDPTLRTDPRDERISFFQQLVGNLPDRYYVSLVKMNDRGANITDCDADQACGEMERVCSKPFRNREPVRCGLRSLQFNELGRTPLNQTLKEVMSSVIEPNSDLNPVVIVFSDGIEAEDPSGDILGEGQAADIYQQGIAGNPVPIVFLHLQPPATSPFERGRSSDFQQLACRSGGEYIFLEDASEFTESSSLQPMVQNRVDGVWRLSTDTNLGFTDFEDGGYLLSTALTVTLGGRERTAALTPSADVSDVIQDSRVWLDKDTSGN